MKKIGWGMLVFLLMFFVSCEGKKEEKKIVFMDGFRVFEEFQLKKDFDKKIESEMQVEKKQVDDLGLQYNVAVDAKKKAELQQMLGQSQEVFQKKFQELSGRYTQEVTNELNKLIRKYGKAHQYDMILSSDGQGNVMYVDTNTNVTSDLIQYINREYKK